MALPDVVINRTNGNLGGLLQTDDGICGIIMTGASEGTYVAGTPLLIRSLRDATTLGLTATNNAFALKHIGEFYAEAGEGAKLYFMLVPATMLASDMVDKTNANGAKKLLDYAARTIRTLGAIRNTAGQTITVTAGMDANIATAELNAHALREEYATNPRQYPFRVILGAQKFSGTAADLVDGNTLTKNGVATVVGDTVVGEGAAVGLVLGRKAKLPVQRKISRVKDGALNITDAYIGSTRAEQYTNTDIIHDRRFITFRTFPGKAGYFFSGDPMRTSTTDDYGQLGRAAVIDKVQVITYATYVEEVEDEVSVEEGSEKMEAGYCKFMEQKILNQLNGIMTAKREISRPEVFIDPDQNVVSTNEVAIVLNIVPVGYSSKIKVNLGFYNPAA